ncbi:MAG: glutamate--cysteine ligase, partial [Deferrisomatales bacterium]
MGRDIDRERFDEADFGRFEARLRECLEALGLLLRRPGFGEGPATLGAELELFLVSPQGGALPINQKVLSEILDSRLTYELDRFDLECNLSPLPLAGRPFAALGRELGEVLALADRGARAHRGRAVAVGILPTFRAADFGSLSMTDVARYRVMSSALRSRRGEPFAVRLEGPDPLELVAEEAVLEGANASFQVHLRVAPAGFTDTYNAAQLATAPVLAACGNSPIFLGHRLWQETRIGLVKQSVDDRPAGAERRGVPARVSFGRRWLDGGAEELFAGIVKQYPAVLPVVADEAPVASASAGRVPELAELRLHTGTVWLWNRPVYDPADGGHLRVELRALPAGPTAVDMVANAA